MNETFIRHFVAFVGTLLVGAVYWGAYVAGVHGWPWAGLGVLIYMISVRKSQVEAHGVALHAH